MEGEKEQQEVGSRTQGQPDDRSGIVELRDGRDELNFAEFPLGLICKRSNPALKTIYFEDSVVDSSTNKTVVRRVTITGADAFGLPTSTDEEVLLALIQLTKLQNFRSRTIHFTRYQLVKLLGWPMSGQSYLRIDESLSRWHGVTIIYKNAWRDLTKKSWGSEQIHILEHVSTNRSENRAARQQLQAGQEPLEFELSSFTWNEVVFRSFEAGNLKRLDFSLLMGLRTPLSKRLYRFVDKRFGPRINQLIIEIKNLCYEHLGLSRSSPIGELKRQLLRAIAELEEIGFLAPLPADERFRKQRAGMWEVRFLRATEKKGSVALPASTRGEVDEKLSDVTDALVRAGVKLKQARELVLRHPEGLIREKIEVLQFLVARKDASVSQNPPGFLVSSIKTPYDNPKGFVPLSKRRAQPSRPRLEPGTTPAPEQEDPKVAAQQAAVDGYWVSLSAAERERAETEAATAPLNSVEQVLAANRGTGADTVRRMVLFRYAKEKLAAAGKWPSD